MICGSLMPLLLLLPLLLQQHLLLLAGCLGGPKVEVDFPDERLFPKGASQLVGHGMQQPLALGNRGVE